ncbi:hypothetical protein TFLX_05222 [Thermoflexales bacterium]|nr:hypothetical protein TFLX_05222 [Thermoflexales bacterium]
MLGPLRDASLIFLICPVMLCLLIPLALTAGAAYLFFRLRRGLPPKLNQVHLQAQRVNAAVNRAGAKVAEPFVSAEAKYTQVETLLRTLFRQVKKDQKS